MREVNRLRNTVQTLVRTLSERGLDFLDDSEVNSPLGHTGLHRKHPAASSKSFVSNIGPQA
jgi:hypothetical protein